MGIKHAKSNIIADFVGVVTLFNSAGLSTTANATDLVRPSDWNSAHVIQQTFGGNTVGASTHSGEDLVLAGGPNITLSYTNGTLSISAPPPFSGFAVAAGTQTGNSGTIQFANSNGITFGMSGSSRVTASHNALTSQSVQTQGSVQVQGSTGAISFANGNGITFGGNASTITASHNALTSQSIQTQGSVQVQGSTGAISFANGNGITFGGNASTITASHNAAASNHSHGNPTLALTNLSGTTASNSAGFTLSLSVAAPGGGGGGVNIAASDTTFTSGTVQFSGLGAATVRTTTGQRVDISVPNASSLSAEGNLTITPSGNTLTLSVAPQTNQTIGLFGSSQTTGQSSSSTIDARSLTIIGRGGISVGLSDSAFIISGATGGGGGGGGINIAASDTTFTSGTVQFSGLGALTVGTTTGQRVNLSVPATSSLSATGAVSISVNGSTVSIGAPVQTNQTVGVYGVSNTTGQSSSSTFDARSISFAGAGVASVGFSGASVIISVPSGGGAGDGVNALVVNGGASSQSTTLTLSNSNNVSFGIAGGVITATASYSQSTGPAAFAAGTQTGTSGTLNFANSNGISFGLSGSSQLTASYTVPTQTNQSIGLYGSSQTVGQSSSSTVDARSLTVIGKGGVSVGLSDGALLISGETSASSLVFSNSNNVSFGINGSTLTATASFTQSNQTVGLYAISNTTQSSSGTRDARSLSFVGAGVASVGVTNGSVVISVPAGGGGDGVNALVVNGGASTASTTITLSNSNNVSFGLNAGVITATASHPNTGSWTHYGNTGLSSTGTTDYQNMHIIGLGQAYVYPFTIGGTTALAFDVGRPEVSVVGNTAGNTASFLLSAPVRHVYSGAGNVTVGLSSVGGNVTHIISGSQSAQTMGLYGSSQTTGQSSSSTIDARSLTVVGRGGVSVGLSDGALIISGATGGGGGGGLGAINNSQTTYTSGTVQFSEGGGAITIASATGQKLLFSVPATSSLSATGQLSISTNGSTISLGVPNKVTLDGYNPHGRGVMVTGQVGQGTLVLDPVYLPDVQFDQLLVPIVNTNSSNSSGSHTVSVWAGFYTRNDSTLSLLASASYSVAATHSGTAGSYSLFSGMRNLVVPLTTTLTEGEYWLGFVSRTTSGGTNGSYSNIVMSNQATNFLGYFGSSHNTTYQMELGRGVYTVTTSGLPQSVAFSHIRGSDSQGLRAPLIIMASGTA